MASGREEIVYISKGVINRSQSEMYTKLNVSQSKMEKKKKKIFYNLSEHDSFNTKRREQINMRQGKNQNMPIIIKKKQS